MPISRLQASAALSATIHSCEGIKVDSAAYALQKCLDSAQLKLHRIGFSGTLRDTHHPGYESLHKKSKCDGVVGGDLCPSVAPGDCTVKIAKNCNFVGFCDVLRRPPNCPYRLNVSN